MTPNAPEAVTCRGVVYEILRGEFWHLSLPNSFLLNNVYLSEGLLLSMSVMNRMPGLDGAVTLHSAKARSDDKEQMWEHGRLRINPNLPSRIGATYLVETEEGAKLIEERWFGGQERLHLKANVVAGSKVFHGDATWLEASKEQWEESAERYWRGQRTDNPIMEVIIDGAVYFPGWRERPFGRIVGPGE